MWIDDNDTLNVSDQFETQSNDQNELNNNEVNNDTSKEKSSKKLNVRDAAVFVGGGVAGAATSMATNAFTGSPEEPDPQEEDHEEATEEQENEEPSNEQEEEEPTPATEPTPEPVPEPEPAPQPQPQPAPQPAHESHSVHTQEHNQTPHVTPTVNNDDEPAFYQENEVKIESIETKVSEDGEIYHTASGTVDGHFAHFIDDGHGNVFGYGVDRNDNEVFEEDEIERTDGQGITMGNLAEHMVEVDQPQPQPTPKPQPVNTHNQTPHVTPTVNNDDEPAFYRENEVKIESLNTEVTEDGDIYHSASGTMNGHEAHFMDDGHGNVVAYGVDRNDNEEIEDDEIVETEGQGITMGNLAEHMVEVEVVPNPTPSQAGDVQVIAVESNLDMDGQNVDVALVTVGGNNGLMIDVTQNGEVDLVSVDVNHDGNFSQNETTVVTDAHLPMPTADDIIVNNGIVDNGELPDYSNDNDITMYDV